MTELDKFGDGLLHFHRGILQSHVAAFPFPKTSDLHTDNTSGDEEYVLLFLHKNSVLFSP